MPESIEILSFFAEMGIQVDGSIIKDIDSPNRYFVHVAISRTEDNKQEPSNKKLNEALQLLAEKGIEIEFLLRDSQGQDIEAGLRATLLHGFSNHIRNAFMSSTDATAHVWLETKQTLDDPTNAEIRRKVSTYLEGFEIELGSIATTTEDTLPSALACLRAIRHAAPITLADLKVDLEKRGFTVPSLDWLKRKLEVLRKADKVVWVTGGKYALTMTSIRNLGTVKGAASPDIHRLLALARRHV